MQTKVLPEALFEWIGEPVELRPFRQHVPNAQNSPSPAFLSSEAIRRPNFTDSELELRVVCDCCLDLHVPLPATMTKLEIEAVAVASVIRLSLYQRQNLQPVLRNPRVPSHDIAPEVRAQKAVGVDLTDNACQIAKIRRWPVGRCSRPDFTLCTRTSATRTRLRQRRELVLAGTGSIRDAEAVETLKQRTVARRSNFERRTGDIKRPSAAFRLLLLLTTLSTPKLSGFGCEAELLTYRLKIHTTVAGSAEFVVSDGAKRLLD